MVSNRPRSTARDVHQVGPFSVSLHVHAEMRHCQKLMCKDQSVGLLSSTCKRARPCSEPGSQLATFELRLGWLSSWGLVIVCRLRSRLRPCRNVWPPTRPLSEVLFDAKQGLDR